MEKYYEEWNGKKYPVRVVPTEDCEIGLSSVDVADYELWAAIESAYNNDHAKKHKRAVAIDDEIFYYCESGFIASDPTDEEIIEYLKKGEVI